MERPPLCPHDREEALEHLTMHIEIIADLIARYPRSGIAQRLAPHVREALSLCDALREEER